MSFFPTELQPVSNKVNQQPNKEVYRGPKTTREWTPIDNYNGTFVDHLQDRSTVGTAPNFIAENKVGFTTRFVIK